MCEKNRGIIKEDRKWDKDSKVEEGIRVLTVLVLMYSLKDIIVREAKESDKTRPFVLSIVRD